MAAKVVFDKAKRNSPDFSDDSSDTDEEESARLKEAVLGNESLQPASESKHRIEAKSERKVLSKPSLRSVDKFDGDFDDQELQTTPEFKSFVSKRLAEYIGSLISDEDVKPQQSSSPEALGIKLFNQSATFVRGDKQEENSNQSKRRKQKCSSSSSSDSDEEKSRLAEAAVSFNFIAENASKLADAVVKNEVNSENVTEKLQLHLEEQKKGDDKIPKKKRIKVKNNDGKDGEFSKQELNPTPISNRRNITVLNEQVIKIEDKLRKHKKKKRKKEK